MRIARRRAVNSRRDASDVFDAIYRSGEWGRGEGDAPYSGAGSRGAAVDRYVEVVAEFIRQHGITSVVDVGCGDFYVGKRLLEAARPGVGYIGVDVSRLVIEHNRRTHASANVRFEQLDAATGEVPKGELCLVRQVMQHLSNAQIAAMLGQLQKFEWAIVTEHYPVNIKLPNIDKPHGGDTRLLNESAVVIEAPPFNVRGVTVLLEVDASTFDKSQGRIVSSLIGREDSAMSRRGA